MALGTVMLCVPCTPGTCSKARFRVEWRQEVEFQVWMGWGNLRGHLECGRARMCDTWQLP